ncbi:hypothetical protein AO393_10040 [Pseudomonas syringae pv. syringae]|nr:hypothetical protein AL063_04725 [Pseudomonas syringae pv. syringae]PHN23835.1 hypothetical protein AO256_07720 [Pseudomonas syringae]PHX31095.1 hypothetical protein AO278_02465 [Pseudomonas syringae pv. syringae]PHX33829.1 hypothetical protein AO354_45745 [Pseudomonas syringae pv. syringae]PHX48910.1 hypothetical protein AO393_10040 [Pseudomonas syringae pv. syringae]
MTQTVDIKDVTNPTALANLQVARATSQVSNNPIELIVQGTPGNDSLRGGCSQVARHGSQWLVAAGTDCQPRVSDSGRSSRT